MELTTRERGGNLLEWKANVVECTAALTAYDRAQKNYDRWRLALCRAAQKVSEGSPLFWVGVDPRSPAYHQETIQIADQNIAFFREIRAHKLAERIAQRLADTEAKIAALGFEIRQHFERLHLEFPQDATVNAIFGQLERLPDHLTPQTLRRLASLLEALVDVESSRVQPLAANQRPPEEQAPNVAKVSRSRVRQPDLEISRRRTELLDRLRGELTTLQSDFDNDKVHNAHEARSRHPGFELWNQISPQEVAELFHVLHIEQLRPKKYAEVLVLRRFGITSAATLKYDRKKLRRAEIK